MHSQVNIIIPNTFELFIILRIVHVFEFSPGRGKLNGFYFNSGTLIVNAGEDVTLPMLSTDDNEVDSQVFRFRSNTSLSYGNKIKIASNEVQHGDVYGARLTGPNDTASLIRIIVRGKFLGTGFGFLQKTSFIGILAMLRTLKSPGSGILPK